MDPRQKASKEDEAFLDDLSSGHVGVDDVLDAVKKSKDPLFLQRVAIRFNWENGYAVPNAIIDNESCDQGVRLTLFWLAEVMCYYTKELQRDKYSNEWADFCDKLIEQLLADPDGQQITGFEPPLSEVQIYQFRKKGVPEVFYLPLSGKHEPEEI